MALRHLLFCLAGLGWLTAAAPIQAQTAAPGPSARADEPRQEFLTIATADGLQLPAQLTLPANPTSGDPVIILLPDGPGGSLAKTTEPARYLARALARQGFAVLGIETRHTTLYSFARFDEAFNDVRAAIDLAASRGFHTVILGGTGMGSLLAARYAAGDDARVKAALLLGPSVDLAAAWRAKVGEETYARTVERATKAPPDSGANLIDLGEGLVFTSAAFLDWYGPSAKTSLTGTLADVEKPVFLAAGANDASTPAVRLQRLAQTVAGKKTLAKTYPGAGRDLYAARTALAADIGRWLADNALAPPPHVVTTVIDTRSADGVALSGVLYAPAVAPPNTRRITFMVVPSLTGDVMRGVTHTLAMKLAQRGHTALVVRTRASGYRNTFSGKLDDIPKDLAAWSDVLTARGASRIVGVGHALGGLWLSTYLSQSQDKRFRGVAYLSPPRDLPGLVRDGMGKENYDRVIAEAEAAVKAGKGATTLITTSFPQATYKDDPRQPMHLPAPATATLTAYADSFLSYWGPDALSMHRERVAEMKVPVFAIGGSRDVMMQGGWLLEFSKYSGGLATSIFYGGPNGASGSFEGFETKAADDIVGWAQRLP